VKSLPIRWPHLQKLDACLTVKTVDKTTTSQKFVQIPQKFIPVLENKPREKLKNKVTSS